MAKLQIPIGIEDYKALKQNSYYVDKTHILKRIIDAPTSTVFLFTRPRRFGKSLAISMVESFFILGEDNSSYFANTKIAREGEDYLKYQNALPVVHLNLKRIDAKDYKEFLSMLSLDISSLYKDAIKRYGLSKDNRPWIDNLLEEKADETLLKTSLDRLLRIINEDTGKSTIVLIDEYDSPLEKAYRCFYYEECQNFMKVFLGDVLKGNRFLEKAMVTGVSQIAHSSIFSDLNNLRVNTVLSGNDPEYFGFEEEEVKGLLDYYGCTTSLSEIRNWYGGYLFQNTMAFNPWSILSFIDNGGTFDAYWTNTGSYSLLKDTVATLADEPYGNLLKLSKGESLVANIRKNIVLGEEKSDVSALYSMLVFAGYLSASLLTPPNLYSVKVPNEEIRQALQREIIAYNGESQLLPILASLRDAFLREDDERIKEVLSQYVLASFSYFDLSCEKIYQIIVVTVISLLFQDAIVKSEVNEGQGRCDLFVRSKNNSRFAFVVEFKYRKGKKSGEELLNSAKTALKQIKANDYVEEALRTTSGSIYAYGMAFSGKKIEVISEKIR